MLPFKLAIRFLKSGRGQTVLIIIGIAVAIGAQVFIGLLINGLQATLIQRTIGNQPQITITSATDIVQIRDWQTIVSKINQTGMVLATSASANGNATIQKGTKITPVLMRGVDAQADNIYGLNKSVYWGSWNPLQQGILVGKELQIDQNYKLGDYILIRTPAGVQANYRIDGFYDLGIASINKSWVFTSLNTAQTLLGYSGNITSIEIKVKDIFEADTIASRLTVELNNRNLTIDNWQAQNTQLLSGLQGQSLSSLMIQIFIILAVVIAIAAILAITVFQKSRQLGILKAMGIKDRSASLIFIFEGLIIGLISAVVGVGLGLGLFYGFLIGTSQPGQPPLVESILDYKFIGLSWIIAVIASVLAALIPARRSLRLNPIEVIREG